MDMLGWTRKKSMLVCGILIIVVIYLKGYWDKFVNMGRGMLISWMTVAVVLLGFVVVCVAGKGKKKA